MISQPDAVCKSECGQRLLLADGLIYIQKH